ncbi:MCE family protein [Mycolicibacterium chitae]|uniref:Virulence factor Mce family protein n=1 Tax=Mycolicibacterium chitae TaxID=1792 RepID=A0A448IA24_MYCCI|nr:MCE family protein [Mycolicibacterium chitae]MCV7105062.1 MCE family protein [Mycolicibacterium chitae]VEG49269.1 virulence factor Mce family protein [Mycolicibacterium chitae]
MKSFSERNPFMIGLVGVLLTTAIVLGALNFKKLPLFGSSAQHSAYFAEASGLRSGAGVLISGFEVGEVTGIRLEDARVLVTFGVDKNVQLGDLTEASIKTKSMLGAKVLEVTPRGEGVLAEAIPLERTVPAYQLPDALGDLADTISGLDTNRLNESLTTLADTFKDTPPDLRMAVEGVSRFSRTINERDEHLRGLLADANKATTVLAERSEQIGDMIRHSNILLATLRTQNSALDQLGNNVSAVAQQLSGLVADNRADLKPALEKFNGVLTMVDNRKAELQRSLKLLNSYALAQGEAVSSGPFYKAYIANLLPGQFVQPFVDAAFSDLGLDPSVLLPSQLADQEIGQEATPPMPVPYPRTGQGGEPRLTLPDAITGKPGDARYPYREPPPAPAPGGPPPGPPVPPAQTPPTTHPPVYHEAPDEVHEGSASHGEGQQ